MIMMPYRRPWPSPQLTGQTDFWHPQLVIEGTGRTADRIAAAIKGDHTDERAAQLADSPLVTAVSWAEGPATVRAALETVWGLGA
jgi:hypothetical protein